jgi:PKHD-type hydroxylase
MFHFPIPPRPPVHDPLPNFVWGSGLFTPAELDKINAHALSLPARQVTVGRDLTVKPEANRSMVRSLAPSADTSWVYQRITNMVAQLNAKHFQFEITGLDEPLYHVTYDAKDQGHYMWHTDVGSTTRKLSITFQMTDPADYDGGDLEMNAFGVVDKCPRERGTLVLFPSYHVHRVTPVTRGTRSALVAWIVGPPFR